MASSRPKTTMNKLNRERKVRERRLDKAARKVARENARADALNQPEDVFENLSDDPDAEQAPVGVGDDASEESDRTPDADRVQVTTSGVDDLGG